MMRAALFALFAGSAILSSMTAWAQDSGKGFQADSEIVDAGEGPQLNALREQALNDYHRAQRAYLQAMRKAATRLGKSFKYTELGIASSFGMSGMGTTGMGMNAELSRMSTTTNFNESDLCKSFKIEDVPVEFRLDYEPDLPQSDVKRFDGVLAQSPRSYFTKNCPGVKTLEDAARFMSNLSTNCKATCKDDAHKINALASVYVTAEFDNLCDRRCNEISISYAAYRNGYKQGNHLCTQMPSGYPDHPLGARGSRRGDIPQDR